MRGAKVTEKTRRVWSLSNTGYNTAAISEITGLPIGIVSNAIHRGRKKGVVRHKNETERTLRALLKKNHITMGSMVWALEQLTPAQRVWVIEQAIRYECESVAELMVEMVRDAYAETINRGIPDDTD